MNPQSRDLLEQARTVLKLALSKGAQAARVTARRSTDSSVERRDAKIDRVRESTSVSIAVALFVDGRFASNNTSDLRPQALAQFLAESIAMTRALAPDSNRVLPDPDRYAGRVATDLRLLDPEIRSISPDWRRSLVSEIEAGARSLPSVHKQIISVSSSCSTSLYEVAKVASNGLEAAEASSSFSLGASVTVRDEGDRKPAAGWSATTVFKSKLPSALDVGQQAALRAWRRRGAAPRRTGEYPCVIENLCASRLIDSLWSALEGQNIQQKKSFLANSLGQRIASPSLTVRDDPHVIEGLGSSLFDGEGMATRARPVIEQGILRSFYLDTYYAKKLKQTPTSGTRNNLVFDRGGRDLEGLLAEMGTGILITNFIGGNSNAATGDFSFGVQGYWIDGGQQISPLAEMNLSGNHLSFWNKLLETGNDPYLFSTNRRPSLRMAAVQFSGK